MGKYIKKKKYKSELSAGSLRDKKVAGPQDEICPLSSVSSLWVSDA